MHFTFVGLALSEILNVVLFYIFSIKNYVILGLRINIILLKFAFFYEGLLSCIIAGPESVTNVVLLPHKGRGPGINVLIWKANYFLFGKENTRTLKFNSYHRRHAASPSQSTAV